MLTLRPNDRDALNVFNNEASFCSDVMHNTLLYDVKFFIELQVISSEVIHLLQVSFSRTQKHQLSVGSAEPDL